MVGELSQLNRRQGEAGGGAVGVHEEAGAGIKSRVFLKYIYIHMGKVLIFLIREIVRSLWISSHEVQYSRQQC